jgi:hypothetical protein
MLGQVETASADKSQNNKFKYDLRTSNVLAPLATYNDVSTFPIPQLLQLNKTSIGQTSPQTYPACLLASRDLHYCHIDSYRPNSV